MRPYFLSLLALLLCTRVSAQEMDRVAVQELNAVAYATYTADFATADSLFSLAVAASDANGWVEEAAEATKNLGIVRYLRGDYDSALGLYQKSLTAFEGLEDKAGQADVLVQMGNFFKKRKELGRSRDMLERAARLAGAAGDQTIRSNALDILGALEQEQGNTDEAEALYRQVLALRKSIKDTVGLSYVYDHLASVDAERGNFERALLYLDSTILIRRQLNDRQGIAIAINNQGEALLASKDTAAAIPYLERSLKASQAIAFTDLQRWTMSLLADAYASTGDLPAALGMERAVRTLSEELYSSETTARIAEMQEKYESEKRAAELALRESQLSRRTAWLIAAALGLGLLLALLFYRAKRQRERREQLLREGENKLRDDRLRISRDLHDNLGAELSIIASNLGRLDHRKPGEGLGPVTEQVRHAMEQMRETIWAVRLEDATWADLIARLRVFATKLPHDAIRVGLEEGMADDPLDPKTVLSLYRFCQEALTNAVKHARATTIEVFARPHQLEIKDDGVGFNAEAETDRYGMTTMRERAEELGMSLIVQSSQNQGTRILLKF